MIFSHIIDDYYLQGWMASAKQKSWWEQNAPDKLYKYDYLVVLFYAQLQLEFHGDAGPDNICDAIWWCMVSATICWECINPYVCG